MADLAKYVVSLEAETAKYRAELEKANRTLKKFTQDQAASLDQIRGAFAGLAKLVSIGMFVGWVKSTIDAADAADEMAERVGLSVETITGLRLVMEQAGVSSQAFGQAMQRMARTATEAAQGSTTAQRAFGTIGVSVTDAAGNIKSMDALLREVSDRFAGMKNGAEKAALAQQIFGRSGASLIPVLNQGGAALDEYIQQSRELGDVWTGELADAAAKFNDNVDVLQAAARGFGSRIAQTLLPNLTAFSSYLIDIAKEGDKTSGVLWLLSRSFSAVASGIATVVAFAGVGVDAIKSFYSEAAAQRGARTTIETDIARIRQQIADGIIPDDEVMAAMQSIDRLQARLREIPDVDPGDFGTKVRARLDELANDVASFWGTQTEAAKASADAQVAAFSDMIARQKQAEEKAATDQRNADRAADMVKALEQQAAMLGQTATQAKVYELAMLGASEAQLQTARSAAALIDAYESMQRNESEVQDMFNAMISGDLAKRKQFSEVVEGLRTEEQAIRDSYARRLEIIRANTQAGSDEQIRLIQRLDETTNEQLTKIEQKTGILAEFGKEAARNIQDSFAQFLFDPFEDGLDGMLQNFLRTVQRMVAEVASQQILKALFGGMQGSSNQLLSAIGAAFAGARANGGPVAGGKAYLVGEKGPEIFVPNSSGSIQANGGGGTSVQIVDQRGAAAPPVDVSRQMVNGLEQIRVLIRSEVGGMFADGSIDRNFRAASMPIRRMGSR